MKIGDFLAALSKPTALEREVDEEYDLWRQYVERLFQEAEAPLSDRFLNKTRLTKAERLWVAQQGIIGPLIGLVNYEPVLRNVLSAGGWRAFRLALHDDQFRRLFDVSYLIEAEGFDQQGCVLKHCPYQARFHLRRDATDPRDAEGHWFFWRRWGRPPVFCRPHAVAEFQRRYAEHPRAESGHKMDTTGNSKQG